MENTKSHSKSFKFFVVLGSTLLSIMGIFHGSGLKFVSDTMAKSNSEDFIKAIFPILFIHTSIHLLGLAALGISTLWIKDGYKIVLIIISLLILISSFAAFYLTAIAPGVFLLIATCCLITATYSK